MGEATLLNFHHLLGQEKAKSMLGRALTRDRIPHGYLFYGPVGVGKMLFARALGAAIHCGNRTGGESCGNCVPCRKMRSWNHPDFTVVRPDKNTFRIAQVRELIKHLEYPPYESATRVIVLEDVHTMGQEAANCLLKTLEEPPPGNVLILTADSSRELLPTIRSRCQLVPFAPLSMMDTAAILIRQGIEGDSAEILARLGEGSPGRSLNLSRKEMIPLFEELVDFLVAPQTADSQDVFICLGLSERLSELKDDLPDFLGLLKLWVRDQLIRVTAKKGAGTQVDEGSSAKNWSSTQLFATLRVIDGAEAQLGRNCNKNLVSEVLLFTIQRLLV